MTILDWFLTRRFSGYTLQSGISYCQRGPRTTVAGTSDLWLRHSRGRGSADVRAGRPILPDVVNYCGLILLLKFLHTIMVFFRLGQSSRYLCIHTYIQSMDPEVCQSDRMWVSHKRTKHTKFANCTELL